LNELRKHAFNTLNFNKIWTETYEFRTNHINILESFGMKKDGILREHIYKKGKRYNSIVHSMLRREYESI
jgi:RimJ/RimL family protein N-acetyltransferase